jgi:hypothetical protein
MKAIEDHEVIVHGVEHSQYFQGCGVSFTSFEDVATGIGDNAKEAFDDALESLAQGDWDVEGSDDWDDVPKASDAALPERPEDEDEDDIDDEIHVFVSVRVKGRVIATPEQLKDKFADRIVAILSAVVTELRESDETLCVSEVYDLHCDDFRWTFNVHTAEQDKDKDELQGVDVTFVICESEEYDGERNGVNFAVEIVGVGGEIVGGITPYNYSDRVWVSRCDSEAIEERFQLVEQADPGSAVQLVTEFLKGE